MTGADPTGLDDRKQLSMRASLLVFTLDPADECARRRLLPGRFAGRARDLLSRCLEIALDAGRGAGCRLEVSSPRPIAHASDVQRVGQSGRTFGERFSAAVRGARARAHGPLVVVGSDVPGLTADHLEQALARLGGERRRVVVGPSPDGGFYLLATRVPIDAELARVRWCSRDTLASLIAALHAAGLEVSLLEPLRDLDRAPDLAAWLAGEARVSPRWRRYVAALRRLLAVLSRPLRPPTLGRPATGAPLTLAVRGPPAGIR